MTTTLDCGIHALPFPEYLALERWGSSSLRAMRRGPPARVMWERAHPKEDTDATRLGTAVHCALLTPELYAATYCTKPEGMSFASKEGKAWRDDPAREGRTILPFEQGCAVDAIVGALANKAAVIESLERAKHKEASLLWDCPQSGEPCKARPDWIEGKWIYDLKVSRHAADRVAMRAYFEGWMHQLAHYRTGAIVLGLPVRGGRLVVVEPTAPHFVYTLEVKADALDLLEFDNIEALKALAVCRENNDFPGTPDEWIRIEPPAGASSELKQTELDGIAAGDSDSEDNDITEFD